MVAEPTANISGTLCLYHYVLATSCPPVIGGGNLGCGFHYSEQFHTCISPCDAHDPDEFLGSQITCSTYLSSDADLPRIHSPAENEYIFSIAMSKGITGPVWLGKDSSSRSWVDGSPMNYTNFAPGVEWNDDEDYCLAMEMSGGNAGFWRFYSCLDDGYTICQAPTNTE